MTDTSGVSSVSYEGTEETNENNDDVNPLVVGRFAAETSDDNSLDVGNQGFVGVAPEYQNYANATDAPLLSDDDNVRQKEEAAAEHDASLARPVVETNPARTFDVDETPPSDRKKPQDAYIDGNRAIMERAARSR